MERVIILSFLFDFAHESRIQRGKEELGGGKIVCFVILVVEENLLGAESLGGCNGVAGVTLEDVRSVDVFSGSGRGKRWCPSHNW
jgi:hypothetical protein